MAVRQNKNKVVEMFPKKSVKTCYVSMTEMCDLRTFTEMKRSKKVEELITTPLHLAC